MSAIAIVSKTEALFAFEEIVGLINNLVNRYANKHLPFEYYSRDLLMSSEARFNWVDPDLKPLPLFADEAQRREWREWHDCQ